MVRKSLTKKIRFEVFKKDSFTCQYCGRMAPDVVLEVDHINPVANGGDNDLMNLVTSCYDCNRGKGKRKLSDKDEIKKQQELLKQLDQKREQLKMMLDWRDGLISFENDQVDEVSKRFKEKTGKDFTDYGKELIKPLIKKYGLIEILDCLDISVNQYFTKGNDPDKAFLYISKIANIRKREAEDPFISKRYYIKGILNNRGMLYNEKRLYAFLNIECTSSDDFEEIKQVAVSCKSWTEFWQIVNETYGGGY